MCTYGCLERGVKVGDKGVLTAEGQQPLLYHSALHVVILQYHVLLQRLDGEVVVCADLLGHQNLVWEWDTHVMGQSWIWTHVHEEGTSWIDA